MAWIPGGGIGGTQVLGGCAERRCGGDMDTGKGYWVGYRYWEGIPERVWVQGRGGARGAMPWGCWGGYGVLRGFRAGKCQACTVMGVLGVLQGAGRFRATVC